MARHIVAPVDDIPPGGQLVQVNGRAVVINLDSEFFALNNRCPHKGQQSVRRQADRTCRILGARRIPLFAQGRDHPLPVAFVGVRHPDREIVVRPAAVEDTKICRLGREGRATRRGPLQGGDVPGDCRERLRGEWSRHERHRRPARGLLRIRRHRRDCQSVGDRCRDRSGSVGHGAGQHGAG